MTFLFLPLPRKFRKEINNKRQKWPIYFCPLHIAFPDP
jgi:hypothetical protein